MLAVKGLLLLRLPLPTRLGPDDRHHFTSDGEGAFGYWNCHQAIALASQATPAKAARGLVLADTDPCLFGRLLIGATAFEFDMQRSFIGQVALVFARMAGAYAHDINGWLWALGACLGGLGCTGNKNARWP